MVSFLRTLGHHGSTVLTLLLLAGLLWWGHHHGWRLAKPTPPPPVPHGDHWCPEHHVPEEVCLLCKKRLAQELAAQEPEAHRRAGEAVRFAQVAAPEVLTKVGIQVATVDHAPVTPHLTLTGELRYPPDAVARLGSRCDGLVRHLLTQVGQTVAPGAVVAVVETAEVGRAKSALMQAMTALDLARAQTQRARVTAAAGLRTPAELEEVEARLRSAEVAVLEAEQQLGNLGLAIDGRNLAGLDAATLAARLRRLGLPEGVEDGGSANLLPIRAPRAGIVTEVRAVVGEAIEAATPLLVIADPSTRWVSLPMPPEQAAQVAVGHAVRFTNPDGTQATGDVVLLAQEADAQTRLVTVWARIPNPPPSWRVGIFGTATITTGTPTPAAWVPAAGVQFDGDQAYVFVRRTATIFRALPVRVLGREAGRVAVDRLAEGDTLAVSGTGTLFAIAFQERMGAGCCAVE